MYVEPLLFQAVKFADTCTLVLVGGQGIASGFRDASGLAWRLALMRRPEYNGFHANLLDGWSAERKQQLDRSIADTVTNGDLCTTRSAVKIFLRDWTLWFLQQIPPCRRYLELGPRTQGMVKYSWRNGMAFLPEFAGGRCLPQVCCRSLRRPLNADEPPVELTDDIIFRRDKQTLFQLIILVDNSRDAEKAFEDLKELDLAETSGELVSEHEVSCIIHCPDLKASDLSEGVAAFEKQVYRIATREEFAASESLCKGRPEPIGYDMNRMRKDTGGKRFVIARPDRFVFATCDSIEDLVSICGAIRGVLFGNKILS